MKYGYARVSTDDQSTALQLATLKRAGCKTLFKDEGLSGATTKRPALLRFLKAFEDGDTLIVLKLDRLGRMTGHGFRGLASTILHEQGYAHEHIELQLAHAPRNAVSAAYNHALYLEPRAKMMRDWADFLERTQRGSKVLLFGGTAASREGATAQSGGPHPHSVFF